jgi:hypothetical protein
VLSRRALEQRYSLFNLLKPSGNFTYHQVYHSQILHVAHIVLSVLYGSQNKQQMLTYTTSTDLFFINEVESVYCAVRTESLYKTDYVPFLRG